MGDLACRCAGSTLVRARRPGTLLAISIECAACGAVTTTPGLNPDQVVPLGARMVERNRTAAPEPFVLAPGMVLADRDELIRVDRRCQPRSMPTGRFDITEATLAAAATDYDRFTGGQLAAHRAAVPPNVGDAVPGFARLPVAWALDQLARGVAIPGWWCLVTEPDVTAAMQLGAFREFPLVWSQHPLFPAMAASAAATGFSTHVLAVFATARCMVASGNRVDFTPPGRDGEPMDGFHLITSPTERVPVLVRRFDRFDWPGGWGAEVAAARAATIDALIASQGRINARQPGILVLSIGVVRRHLDPIIAEGIGRAMRDRGRRHRGLVAVAVVLPEIFPTERPDQVGFGWTFLPFANPYHTGSGIQLAPPQGAAT